MKILLVNGSPKPADSASALVLRTLRGKLGTDHDYTEVGAKDGARADAGCMAQDAIVIAFPLYVDSLPSRLLEWLLSFEAAVAEEAGGPGLRPRAATAVFAVCNCGFHEGLQTRSALRIVRNFARKQGFTWGGGLGIGSGGMLQGLASVPEGVWIKRRVSEGISWIAGGIAAWGQSPAAPVERGLPYGDHDDTERSLRFVSHAFPRFAYRLAAHAEWRKAGRGNGLKARELRARPIAR
jgi:hypothetical protein